jgi:hypothetical protein
MTFTYANCVKVALPLAMAVIKKLKVPEIGYKSINLTIN